MSLTPTRSGSRHSAALSIEAVQGAHVQVNGQWLLSFVSANYLGLSRHPKVIRAMTRAARAWGISHGTPRSLMADPITAHLEQKLARLVRQDRALLFPSTTHIALDVLPLLAGRGGILFVDEWAYPISLEGVWAAARRGARVKRFPHNDHQALTRLMRDQTDLHPKVIVCDGVYPADGRPAPLDQIARIARAFDATVYVDDAHGIGVLGEGATLDMPYGYGGGGTPRFFDAPPGNVVYAASLSKAFGVPLAFVAGTSDLIARLDARSAAHVHSSPPSIPVVAAASSALDVHAACGDQLRRLVLDRVRQFRSGLADVGIKLATRGLFPLQFIPCASPQSAASLGRALRQRGVWALARAHPYSSRGTGALLFVLTARHTARDIEETATTIANAMMNCHPRLIGQATQVASPRSRARC